MYHAITQAIQCCVVKVTTPFTGRLATLLVASLVGVGDGRYESHLAISPDKEHTQKKKEANPLSVPSHKISQPRLCFESSSQNKQGLS